MVDLDDLLFSGSIVISMDNDEKLIGIALVKIINGVVPIVLSYESIDFIKNYKLIFNKLKNGNKLYCNAGYMYIGYDELRGPYAEDDVFVSFCDTQSLFFEVMLSSLEYKLSKNDVRRKELIKVGDFYKNNY